MPVPKRKLSRARRDSRSANKGIKPQACMTCSNCQEPTMAHIVCAHCGFYKGRKVLKTKLDRTVNRTQTRQAMAQKAADRQQEHEGHAHDEGAGKSA